MTTYLSLLRGINVSGQKTVKMDVLKEMYEGLHFLNVHTYIQSGNVVFQVEKSDSKDLEMLISNQLQNRFGFEVPVIVMESGELKDIIARNPYSADTTKDISYMYVTFLSSKPAPVTLATINKVASPGEELIIINAAVYLYCPNGYGKTKLTNTYFEKIVHVQATTRNWKTTLQLMNIAENMTHT